MPDPNDKRTDKHPGAPRGLMTGQDWPACRYGPNGESKICHSAADVPEGWEDHPGKFNPEAVQDRAARKQNMEEREEALLKGEAALAAKLAAFTEASKPAPKSVLNVSRPTLKIKKVAQSAPLVTLGDYDEESDEGE